MAQRKKYQPNLKAFMALCASNYAKMCQLLPNKDAQLAEDFSARIRIAQQPDLLIKLVQQSRHTQTFQLQQADSVKVLARNFYVRLYHDAQMAEILSGVSDSMLPPVYPVPNAQMKQADEKLQLNRFLGEWLSFCLENGQATGHNKTDLAFLC
ncbi:DUF1249 domain-containing protein [Kangiella sp. TOML190]|uniref:DUF1249 domain-containing protein n=1 Tax=Kangiella sp. TOML190 TaxID=2931351 RepID=UPI00203F2C09|nr:DUF1249 domain-containing protein [Kangiella sp. TOML190]